ncbi:MAG: group I truncated hemoglobin [Thermoleophilia bacterium]
MYRQIGGESGLKTVVDHFYERLWADPELKPYFAGIDGEQLKRHQAMFLTFVLGGGASEWAGVSLGSAHSELKITDDAFSKVAWHLTMTLDELDINRSLSMIINGFVEGVRGQVVTA